MNEKRIMFIIMLAAFVVLTSVAYFKWVEPKEEIIQFLKQNTILFEGGEENEAKTIGTRQSLIDRGKNYDRFYLGNVEAGSMYEIVFGVSNMLEEAPYDYIVNETVGNESILVRYKNNPQYKPQSEVMALTIKNGIVNLSWWNNSIVAVSKKKIESLEEDLSIADKFESRKEGWEFLHTYEYTNINMAVYDEWESNLELNYKDDILYVDDGINIVGISFKKTIKQGFEIKTAKDKNTYKITYNYNYTNKSVKVGDTIEIDPLVIITSINEDGDLYQEFGEPPATKDDSSTTAVVCVGCMGQRRAYFEWDTSSISDAAEVTDVDINVSVNTAFIVGNMDIYPIDTKPSTEGTPNNIYDDCGDGTLYVDDSAAFQSTGWQRVDLGASADTDLENQLSVDWFAVGMVTTEDGTCEIDTVESANDPQLRVTYVIPPPTINFTYPTPNNDSTLTVGYVSLINISVKKVAEDISKIIFDWNGSNFTYYNDSLVLMFNFDNVTELGEGLGDNVNITYDSSSHKHNGTCDQTDYGCVYIEGKYGRALNFDGEITDGWLETDTGIPTTNGTTIAFWIYFNSSSSATNGQCIMCSIPIATPHWYMIEKEGSLRTYNYRRQGSTNDIGIVTNYGTIATGININEWTHITIVQNATNETAYVNGVEKETLSFNMSSGGSNNDFRISRDYWDDPSKQNSLNASIDEIRIWNISLNSTQVYQQYAANLNKGDTANWTLIINQSKSATAELDNGEYTYQAHVEDALGNKNNTDIRTVNINVETTDTCDCPSPASDWNINCADNCEMTANCDLTSYDINMYGSGLFTQGIYNITCAKAIIAGTCNRRSNGGKLIIS